MIERVGPRASFLSESHTLKNFHKFWVPGIFDRTISKSEGQGDCEQLVRRKIDSILKTHHPRPFPEEVKKEVTKMERMWLKRVGLKEYPKRE